ncbi:MAG: cytidylyltransferase family protein [Hyphomicrobiales bacterium]|nr:cytidylyltransferase family protein [Hyphomicrobiales bacterium]
MKFGPVPLDEAEGGILAHTVRHEKIVLKKGAVLSADHVAALRAAGVETLVVARMEYGDVTEDEAAAEVAREITGDNIRVEDAFTGRANLYATCNGVLVAEASLVDAINEVDEQITLATLPPWRSVVEGEMVGTVKVIPFAVPAGTVTLAIGAAAGARLRVERYRPMRIGVISTVLPGLKPSTIDKTLRVMRERIAPAGASIVADLRCPHETQALRAAIEEVRATCDLIVVFGASAITDRRDVIPSALTDAGGRIEQFGMPVDPGNLLLIGDLDGKPFLGAPGCARSPKENGFDWVLQRMLAEVPVSRHTIRRMGSGGLLMEIVSRPQPRTGGAPHDDD